MKNSKQIEAEGGPAFPVPDECEHPGMTLLEWYAGQALMGLCMTMDSERCRSIAEGVSGGRFEAQAAMNLAKKMIEGRHENTG